MSCDDDDTPIGAPFHNDCDMGLDKLIQWQFRPTANIDLSINAFVNFVGYFEPGAVGGLWFHPCNGDDSCKIHIQPHAEAGYKAIVYFNNQLFQIGYAPTPIHAILDCFHFAGVHVDPNDYNLNPVDD